MKDTERNKGKEGRYKGQGMGDYSCSLCDEITSDTRNEICEHCGASMDAFDNPHRDYDDVEEAFSPWQLLIYTKIERMALFYDG